MMVMGPTMGLPMHSTIFTSRKAKLYAQDRARAGPCIVLTQTPLQVGWTTDIGPVSVVIFTPQYVDEAVHRAGVTGNSVNEDALIT